MSFTESFTVNRDHKMKCPVLNCFLIIVLHSYFFFFFYSQNIFKYINAKFIFLIITFDSFQIEEMKFLLIKCMFICLKKINFKVTKFNQVIKKLKYVS